MEANPFILVIDLLAQLGAELLSENKPAPSDVLGRETGEADETPARADV
jgi:hypothetical protein